MSAAINSSWLQSLPPRLRIGRKKSHWLLEAAPAAVEDDALTALRRRLAGLGTSELSLFTISEYNSEFERYTRQRRRLMAESSRNSDGNQSAPRLQHQQQQRPLTSVPKVRFTVLNDDIKDREDAPRPVTTEGDSKQRTRLASTTTLSISEEEDGVVDVDAHSSDVASVSEAGDVVSFPADLSLAQPPPINPDALAKAEARRSAALQTLTTVTGSGDAKHRLASAFCDSAWLHTHGDFARPRSVTYGQNLRLHPNLSDTIRAGIIAGRREFDSISFAGLSERERLWPSLAKTRHDRVIDWLRMIG